MKRAADLPIPSIPIGRRRIGAGEPVYIVAEMSANHCKNFDRAVQILQAAKEAGADAIKLQTYLPETMTIRCDSPLFVHPSDSLWSGKTLYDLYTEAYMPWEWHPKLQEVARELGLELFSTAYDLSSVEFLEQLNVPLYKIASFELVDIPLIERVARTGKPLVLSTGMATREEIEEALQAARRGGASQLVLLKCSSSYPALAQEMNLRSIPDLARRFQVPVGLSDHTLGTVVAVAAVCLGACLVEKHLTLSRSIASHDRAFSLEPQEFKAMVDAIRTVEKTLGEVRYGATEREAQSRVFRRSLFAVRDIRAGEVLTTENVRSIRPGQGLHTRHLPDLLGKRAKKEIPEGTPMSWDLVGS